LEKEKSQTRRLSASRPPIQKNEKGIPAGVITRKDALVRDDIIAATGRQRNEGVEKNRHARRNGAAEQSARWHS